MTRDRRFHEVKLVAIDSVFLHLSVDDQDYRIRWTACSKKLANATAEQRRFIDIAPSGYGIHWPLVDEDLAIDPLLKLAETNATEPAIVPS